MKRKFTNLFGQTDDSDKWKKPSTSSESQVQDDLESFDENKGLLLLKSRKDSKDVKLSDRQTELMPRFSITSNYDHKEDPRITKPLDEGVAVRMREELFNSMKEENLERLNKIIREINNHGVVLQHKKLLNDSGLTVLHEALKKRHLKAAKWLIENSDCEFLATGYVNIDRQIPPSYKTSLHMLSEIGDVTLTEILLRRLKSLNTRKDNEGRVNNNNNKGMNGGVLSTTTVKSQKKSNKHQSGIYDWMVLHVKNEPHRRVQCIHLAVMNDHHELIRLLITHGSDVNSSDGEGESPLAWAAKCGHLNSVKTLLELKAQVNQANAYDCTPLHWACEKGHNEVVTELLRVGSIDVNKARVWAPRTALEIAATLNHAIIVKQILKTGQVDRVKKLDALVVASNEGHKDVVAEVLNNCPDLLDESSRDGDTALLAAAEKERLEVVQLLLELGADLNKKNSNKKTVLDLAMTRGDNKLLEYLIKAYRSSGNPEYLFKQSNYIHMAAADGDVEKMKFLSQSGMDYRMVFDKLGNTFVHAAVSHNQVNILDEFLFHYDDVMNQQNGEGDTPVHIAARKGFLTSVEKLISLKARLNIKDKEGRTALHAAVMCPLQSSIDIVKTIRDSILESGIRILNEVDKSGYTALHLACKHKRADLIPELKQLDPECTFEIPLHVAVRFGTVDVIRTLLDVFCKSARRIKIDSKDSAGSTALHICARLGLEKKFELLVKRRADMSQVDNARASILHRMIEVSISTPHLADYEISIYNIMVKYAAHWWARKKDMVCPPKETRDFHFMRMEGVRYLTCEIFYNGMNVLQYASKLGALALLKEILNTRDVFKITKTSPLICKNVVRDVALGLLSTINRNKAESEYHVGILVSTMFVKEAVMYDVTYLVPGNMPKQIQQKKKETFKEKGSDKNLALSSEEERASSIDKKVIIKNFEKTNLRAMKCKMMSCLELIVNIADDELAADLLDSEPFKILVENYWVMCRRVYETLMWIHVLYMICFSFMMAPTTSYLRQRFHINGTHREDGDSQYQSVTILHGLFLVNPCLLLLYQIISAVIFAHRVENCMSVKFRDFYLVDNIKMSDVTSGLMRIPIGFCMYVMNNLAGLCSFGFGISVIIWYIMYISSNNAQSYLQSLAFANFFGWLHAISYIRVFKTWDILANIIKKIFIKDLIRFTYIYVFFMFGFGFCIHVLMLADYETNNEDRPILNSICRMYYRMLSPEHPLDDIKVEKKYNDSGASSFLLRVFWFSYSAIANLTLMNLVIAMMNSTYAEVKTVHKTGWRVDSLRMVLWIEKHLPFKLATFKTKYDGRQNRWYLSCTPEDYTEVAVDEEDLEKDVADQPPSPDEDCLDDPLPAQITDEYDLKKSLQKIMTDVKQLRAEIRQSRKNL